MKNNVRLHVPVSYIAGASSPTAVNLSVQGMTKTTNNTEKKHEKVSVPFFYVAGSSSPTAGNMAAQGIGHRTSSKSASSKFGGRHDRRISR